MDQVIFRIPIPWQTAPDSWWHDGIPIYGFGLMLFIAFILCTWLASRRATRLIQNDIGLGRYLAGPNEGQDFPAADTPKERAETARALIQDLAIWLFIAGLAGARITYMIHHPEQGNFWTRFIDITNGGIILYGSLLGGFLGYLAFSGYLYWRRHVVLNTLRIADIAAPSIAVGIGLGRIGCLLNGCCYGHVACADCAAVPAIHFPLSAPPRTVLVEKGYQTAAGFTIDEQTVEEGVLVGTVDPDSPAYQAGLRPGQIILAVNGKKLDTEAERALTKAMVYDWKRGEVDLVLTIRTPDAVAATAGPAVLAGAGYTLPAFRPRTLGLYPTQLFETVSMALLLLLLLAFFAYRRHDGQVMALLMMCYAVHRTLNEMLRDDIRPVGFESYASYFLFAAGAALMLWVVKWRTADFKSEWQLA